MRIPGSHLWPLVAGPEAWYPRGVCLAPSSPWEPEGWACGAQSRPGLSWAARPVSNTAFCGVSLAGPQGRSPGLACPASDVCPLCCARARAPCQRDSGASACRTSAPSGETAPLLPPAPLRLGPGGPAANMASPRCPGVLLRAPAAQVGALHIPSALCHSLTSLRGLSTLCHSPWPWPWTCHQQRCPSDHAWPAEEQCHSGRPHQEAGLGSAEGS